MNSLTRETAKVVVLPMDHFNGPRLTHRTWVAALAPRDSERPEDRTLCQHTVKGHRTTEAAVKCGTSMWEGLS